MGEKPSRTSEEPIEEGALLGVLDGVGRAKRLLARAIGLGDFRGPPDYQKRSSGNAASWDGSIVVGRGQRPVDEFGLSGSMAFRWTQRGGLEGLGGPGDDRVISSRAFDVSADGRVVVGDDDSQAYHEAFRWVEGRGMHGLGDLLGGGFHSNAFAVSADGSTVVGCGESEHGRVAFLWREDLGMVGLGHLPRGEFYSAAWGGSGDGSIVVGSGARGDGFRACIWDEEHGMRDLRRVVVGDYGLDLNGWILVSARGIAADGSTIVGEGMNRRGDLEGWVARIGRGNAEWKQFTGGRIGVVPELGFLGIMAVGASALVARRRR